MATRVSCRHPKMFYHLFYISFKVPILLDIARDREKEIKERERARDSLSFKMDNKYWQISS